MLADLQKRRVFGGLNEIAFRVDQKQPHRTTTALGCNQHAGRCRLFHCDHPIINFDQHFAQHVADDRGHLQHGRRLHDRGFLGRLGIFDGFAQPGDGGLGDRQAACSGDGNHPLARVFKMEHFAVGGDVIKPRIGAGV